MEMNFRWRRTSVACLLCLICGPICFAAQPPRLLVKNARLFTMAPQQKDPFTGYLLVADDGTILTVGSGNPPPGLTAKQVFDAEGKWIMPGFISAHSHLWQAAYRGIAADKTLLSWIDDLYVQRAAKASPEDMYWFCLLGALDHLQNGITATYNFNYARIYWQGDDNDFDKAEFRAEEKSGIRFIHGYEPGMIHTGVSIAQARGRLSAFLNWVSTQHPSPDYLGVMLNGGTAFNDTYQQSVMEKALMDEFSLSNQSHYLEPPEPSTQTEERTEFHWFADSGLLSNKLIFGHFIHTDDSILSETVKFGVGMTWNPLSNGRMASGVADIPKYLKMGMKVGMGIDGEASGDLADPFENMRAGLYAVRDKYQDATVISAYQVLMLHTLGSADVLGLKKTLGSLEPGKYADFLVIDPDRLGAVLEDPYANLVLAASERDVDRVYVGGELEVEHGHLLQQDLARIQKEVNQRVSNTNR
jgi:5-methylthioadenosine/S-adenosylhomocysteine deaminase